MGEHPVPEGAKAVDWKAYAAPELYEALKSAMTWIQALALQIDDSAWESIVHSARWHQLESAIAKAEGKS